MRSVDSMVIALGLVVAACGGGVGGPAKDAGATSDSGRETALDAGLDSGSDAGHDGGDAGGEDPDASPERCPEDGDRDMWVWGSSAATDVGEQLELLAFAREHDLRTLYVESER